jgi:hypothetical protein
VQTTLQNALSFVENTLSFLDRFVFCLYHILDHTFFLVWIGRISAVLSKLEKDRYSHG